MVRAHHTPPCSAVRQHVWGRKQRRGLDASRIITEKGRADAHREWSLCCELSTDAKGTVAMKEGFFLFFVVQLELR